MKLIRFDDRGTPRHGWLEGDAVEVLSGAPWSGGAPTGVRTPRAGLALLAPCVPTKIVCVGRNYAAHAAELGNAVPAEPLIFLKPASAVIGPGASIVLPAPSEDVQHEAELGVVIGRRCRNLAAGDVAAHVFGFTCVNDVTARDIQRAENHFTRAKGFDTFCPIGPWIVPGMPAGELGLRCRVNGVLRQDDNTARMIHSVEKLVAFISRVMTLEPGDVISTGTPAGVGRIAAGDTVEIEIDGVGTLSNPVTSEG